MVLRMSTKQAMLYKHKVLSLLMACFLIISGCSSKTVVTEVKEVPVLTPSSLMVDPCEPKGVGYTVRSLASGYVSNTSCLGQYRLLLIKQRKYREEVIKVYGNQ